MSQGRDYELPVYKVVLVRERPGPTRDMSDPSSAAGLFAEYFSGLDRECFVVAMLDTKLKLIGLNTVSIGSLNQSVVHQREVFKPAILSSTFAILLGHNHPSGSVLPSVEDKKLTERLVCAGKILGIEVLDHIIVGYGKEYYSMKEHNDI